MSGRFDGSFQIRRQTMFRDIPLNKLVPSPRNVRRRHDDLADAQLKADIAARGLLQNLVVRENDRGRFEVEAGGRRYKALTALAAEKHFPRTKLVTCLVLGGDEGDAREASLAENFHKLAMNPADEAAAFASIIDSGATVEDVARRFGLTVRFVEGRLRLANLAPVVFEALASGDITLDLAKAFGATSDIERQATVFEEVVQSPYRLTVDSVRRMVLTATVTGADPRAKHVGRDAYVAAGGRIDRELFDDEASESWTDVALLERLATEAMAATATRIAQEQGLAWVRPTLESYLGYGTLDGLTRLPLRAPDPTPEETERLAVLDAEYDAHAAVLEDEEADAEACAASEAAIARIDHETAVIRHKPPVLPDELRADAGTFLLLGRDGIPRLEQAWFMAARPVANEDAADDAVAVVESHDTDEPKRATLSQKLIDELAMQRRDILALHLANDPALALDVAVFSIADDSRAGRSEPSGTTLRGTAASGPVHGFEATDAPATAAFAEARNGLDISWCAGDTRVERFVAFRELPDEARAAWLGMVVARTLEASLNIGQAFGPRGCAFHDLLGSLLGIDVAAWWRPTAANFFDRVSKATTLDALSQVGGPELASRYAGSKKAELAAAAERIFSGNFIAEIETKQAAIAWVPDVMRFEHQRDENRVGEPAAEDATPSVVDHDDEPHTGLAA